MKKMMLHWFDVTQRHTYTHTCRRYAEGGDRTRELKVSPYRAAVSMGNVPVISNNSHQYGR